MKRVLIMTLLATGLAGSVAKAQEMNGLNKREQKIATIAANTALGKLDALKEELAAALDAGLTINEINEILIQMYAYCGFPRSLQGINTLMALLSERKIEGMDDPYGEEAQQVEVNDKYAYGKETLEQLTGIRETSPTGANAFAPGIDLFLKEHLFADIFGRGLLTYREREIATVSALSGLTAIDPMIRSHINIALNTGLSKDQITSLIETIKPYIGQERADNALAIFAEVIDNK